MQTLNFLVVAGVLLMTAVSAGAANYNDAGCGLGSSIFSKNTKGQQILAGTTNGVSSQSSAVSSQTSGCREDGMVKRDKQREVFAAVNFRSLTRELAAGKGEYASSLASLMGCSERATPQFLAFAKERYVTLFPGQETTPRQLIDTMESSISAHPVLSTACVL